jgi:hypothetical protein
MLEIGPKKLPNYHTLCPLSAEPDESEEELDELEQSHLTVINDNENDMINSGPVVVNTVNQKEIEHAGRLYEHYSYYLDNHLILAKLRKIRAAVLKRTRYKEMLC